MVLSKDLIIDWYNQYNNDPDNDKAALNVMQAFINAVNAQCGKKIPQADCENLIDSGKEILDLLYPE